MRLTEENGGKVKPLNYQIEYNLEKALEIQRCKNDIFYFIEKYVKIEHPTRGAIKFNLYEYQRRLLRAYLENRKCIVNLPRQSGKTVTSAIFLLWWAIFKENQDIVIISKTGASAKDVMERLWYTYEELPWFLKPGVKTNNVQTKELENGSTIKYLNTTEDAGRGLSISLIYLDEFAFNPYQEKLWTAVSPAISTGGKCIMTSTPNNDEDKFASIWYAAPLLPYSDPWEDKRRMSDITQNTDTIFETEDCKEQYEILELSTFSDTVVEEDEKDRFYGFHVNWKSVPYKIENGKIRYRDEGFKREQFSSGLREAQWASEFLCLFISGDATLISPTILSGLNDRIRPPLFVDQWGCRWYEEIRPNTSYTVVLDPSEGIDQDDACIQVWEVPYLEQVAEWHSNTVDQPEQAKMLSRVLRRIYGLQQTDPAHDGSNNIYYSIEKNGLGIGIINALQYEGEHRYPGWLISSSNNIKGKGLITTAGSKKQFALELKSLIERDLFTPRSKYLVSQLKTFVRSGQHGYKAKSGKKDDIVMSCILMCHLIQEVRTHEPDLDDRVRVEIDDYDQDDSEHPDNMAFGILF